MLIGPNGSGKTFALKGLYSAIKAIEQCGRGKEPRTLKELLSDSLYWTFQVDTLGEIVRKGDPSLTFSMKSAAGETLSYSFSPAATKVAQVEENTFRPTEVNSIFIPAKEVASLQDVILRSHDIDKAFGFDKTYVDLARALSKATQGKNYKEFADARKSLSDAVGGRLEYDEAKGEWIFQR